MTTRPARLLLDNRVSGSRLPRQALSACLEPLLRRHARGRSLEVVFVDGRMMRRLNRDFHATDAPTDVLAFPHEGDLLGEVIVCVDVARREARSRRLTVTSELVLYAVHGTLHLLGWDDRTPAQARRMRQAEVRALGAANLVTDRLRESA